MKHIYEFGESDNDQWYLLDGKKVECNPDITNYLWMQWINHSDPHRTVLTTTLYIQSLNNQ